MHKGLLHMNSEVWKLVLQNVMDLENLDLTFLHNLREFVLAVLRDLEANNDSNLAKLDIETRKK